METIWRRILPVGLAVFCLATAVMAQEKQTTAKRPPREHLPEGTTVMRDVAYVTNGHARQKLDLFLPAKGEKVPLVVWIHGGGWQGGNKEGAPAVGLLWQGGYAVASIEYRFSQDAPYPAQIEDCKAAIRWLRANAKNYNYDPNCIGVWGHSAGGHLVALLGTTGGIKDFDKGENLEFSSRVQAVIDFSGPTDLSFYGNSRPGDTLSQLIGGPIQDNKEKVAKANPITFITKDAAPFLIMHGDKDPIVPLQHSQALEEALKKAGVEVTLRVIPGAGHGFGGNEVNQAVGEFFKTHLGAKTK